jgi:HSP20 family protein
MLLRTWDPFGTLARLDTELDRSLRRSWRTFTPPTEGLVPPVEVSKDGDDVVLTVELPGVDVAKDVDVEVEGRRLVVRGERRDEREDESNSVVVRELRYGSFRRSFRLPEGASADDVEATYDKGLLTLRVKGVNAVGEGARKIAIQAAEPTAVEADTDSDAR